MSPAPDRFQSSRSDTDLWDLTRVVRTPGERKVVDASGHVHHDLILVHGDGRASSLLHGQHNDCGVVCTEHALLPKEQRRAPEAAGTRHALRPLASRRRKKGFTLCRVESHPLKRRWCARPPAAYHHFVVGVAHVDGVLGRHHVPQPVAAQDDVAVALGVEGHHGGVGLGRNHKLAAVEVVAPQIALRGGGNQTGVKLMNRGPLQGF